MRPVALACLALALCGAVPPCAAARAGAMRVEMLAADTAGPSPPADTTAIVDMQGAEVQLVVPYRKHGTWLRVTLPSLPPEPRLVVNGVAAGRVTLLLPDGRRIERAKTSPAHDAAASSIAAAFALPPEVSAGDVLWLFTPDRHRQLVDVRLLAASEWRARERLALAFAVAIYGAAIAFAIIAASYWLILRERMFADHALYLAALVVFMTMTLGVFYELFPDGFWARRGILAQWGFATAAIAFALGFANRFIDVARHLPRTARWVDRLRFALLALAVAVTLSPVEVPYFGAAMALTVVSINVAFVGLGVYVASKRNRYAGYFLAGWIPLTLCTSLRALQGTGFVQVPYETSYFYSIGVIWEALVLTAGIADRALSFRRERDVAQHLAEHDGLTGALNRRASEERLEEHFRRAHAASTPLAVFFLDLDHFKSINDRFGHAAGDAVLVAIAGRIKALLRADDILGRWGGEEFVAILPGAPPEAVRATGERIRRAVESEPVHADGELIPVTVSVGVAMLGEDIQASAELVRRADAALYRAKGSGRNRVEEAPLAA
jgi:diguanylate cyclase (GGDEF)-like protein